MLEHLLALDPEPLAQAAQSFVPLDNLEAGDVLGGKILAEKWLADNGADLPVALNPAVENALATQAVAALYAPPEKLTAREKRDRAMQVRTPEAARKVMSMLTAYDWAFVEQAQNIRSYIVSGLMEETQSARPDVRLKAYKLLGDVTEIGLFTQRTEVVTKNLSDAEIEAEIKKRLERLTINPDTPLVTRMDSEVDDD